MGETHKLSKINALSGIREHWMEEYLEVEINLNYV
jgi:hypothetical protein